MANVEVRRTVVIAKVLYVGRRNSRIPGAEHIADFIEGLGIGVVGVERQAVTEALSEAQVERVVVGTIIVPASVVIVEERVGTVRSTCTRDSTVERVAVFD